MKIVRTRLSKVFDALVKDLERREIGGIELHTAFTRIETYPARVLFNPKHGMFAALCMDTCNPPKVELLTMQLVSGDEATVMAGVQCLDSDNIFELSAATAYFFTVREGLNLQVFYDAYPELDARRHCMSINHRQVSLVGFLT